MCIRDRQVKHPGLRRDVACQHEGLQRAVAMQAQRTPLASARVGVTQHRAFGECKGLFDTGQQRQIGRGQRGTEQQADPSGCLGAFASERHADSVRKVHEQCTQTLAHRRRVRGRHPARRHHLPGQPGGFQLDRRVLQLGLP